MSHHKSPVDSEKRMDVNANDNNALNNEGLRESLSL